MKLHYQIVLNGHQTKSREAVEADCLGIEHYKNRKNREAAERYYKQSMLPSPSSPIPYIPGESVISKRRLSKQRSEFWEEFAVIGSLIGIGFCIGVIACVWMTT